MAIECNEISQVSNELLIAFKDCNKVKNEDLRKFVKLVLAANTCATHTHTKSQITDFAHTHPISDVTGLSMALNDLQLNKEDKSNKQNSLDTDATGTKYPTVTAVKNAIDSIYQPDIVIRYTAPTRVDNTFTFPSGGYDVLLSKQFHTNVSELETTIAAATDGFKRIDLIYYKADDTIAKIQGTESATVAVRPEVPAGGIELCLINVFGDTIEVPEVNGAYVQKSERANVVLTGSGVINQLNLVDEKATIVFKGSITQLNTISYASVPYNGKRITLFNAQATPVTIGHSVSGYGVDFVFADAQDYILLPNQTIEFSFDITYAPYTHHMFIGSKGITNWSELQGKPSTFPPSAHTHTVSQITDFPTFKTIENQSIIGAGNIDLDKNSVGLGNVDNTSDLNKTISTATQTALNAKANISGQVFTGAVSATNLSGTNTGDNTPNSLYSGLVTNATHTGEVTGSTALTITNGAVTNAKLANVATSTLKGRVAAATGVVEDLTASQVRTLLNVADGANNYVHPANHLASIITQDASNRFVTDTEKSAWNAKEPAIASGTISQYWRGDKTWQEFPTIQTIDNIPTDGSNNAVSSNGVFDGLALKANLASPALTGTPTAPTATAGTNTTQIATTSFVTSEISTADSGNVKLTGNQTISGQKSFSLTGKIDMQTNNGFPAISVTSLGSNGLSAAEFINNSSSPYSTALRLRTSSSGGVGNMALNVSNQSSIGIGIVSDASNGGVSISSQSGNGDSYISNITLGGTGRNYVGRNNGTETYSVDKIGNVIGSSYIKRSAPANNLLLAGGGDIAQGTFALASSVHNPVTLGTANGLSLSTQQISLGLASSGVTGALSGTDWNTFNGKFNTPTGLTTNYLPKWNGSGFGNSSLREAAVGVTWIGEDSTDDVPFSIFSLSNQSTIGFKSSTSTNAFNVRLGASGEDMVFRTFNFERLRIKSNGRILINKTDDDLINQLQVAGTISASPATTANQVPTWGQVQAAARPYKVYTALLSQTGTNAPTATVLENTLGGTVVWTRFGTGVYKATLSNAFTSNKTFLLTGLRASAGATYSTILTLLSNTASDVQLVTTLSDASRSLSDGLLTGDSIEIRVYN